ncbi:MAG: hypothetical protein JWM10_365 [Myxococcaceae bacterium]|nr:hypothetical protein [Myxococcaceae bacterium]
MPDPRFSVLVDDQPLDGSALGLLFRLEVRESDDNPTVASLRFRLSQQPDGNYAPLDDDLFAPSTKLRVSVEAPGGLLVALFHGYVTHLRPHFETIESNAYLEVLAMDAASLLDTEERAHAYPDSTDADAATEVFRRYDIEVEAAPTEARHEASGMLLVQRSTDWAFVQRLARRNGYVCYLEPDPRTGDVKAYFRPRALDADQQADLTLMREGTNLNWVDLQLKGTGPTYFKGATIDPIAKRMIRTEGAPVVDALGDSRLDDLVERGLRGAGVEVAGSMLRDAFPLAAVLDAEGSAATDRALFAIEARGSVDPSLYRGLLRARRTVPIKGIGQMLTGLYYVRSVRTVVDEGVLTQSFVAERNALGLSGREDFGRQAEEVPPQ